MKKITALLTLTVLASLVLPGRFGSLQAPRGTGLQFGPALAWAAPQQAEEQQPATWSSREEYEAYTAMAGEKDGAKKIALADAFLQKYPKSFMRDRVHVTIMQTYQQLGDGVKALEAGQRALQANPDNLDILTLEAYLFPFVFKADDPDATSKLSGAENDAKHALDLVQKMPKPADVSDEQFHQAVKARRALFNGLVGFVALQRKDYGTAVSFLKPAAEDNPADSYTFYRLGLAYLYNTPRDYDQAIWNIARAASLAKAAKDPNVANIESYLKQTYIGYHGNDQGLAEIMAQAAASPTAPEGFKVAQMETPKETGNASVDAFNQTFFQLKYGGERAQKLWDSLKGQPFGVGGFVESVEKVDAGYSVRIDVLDQSKAADGVYDIDLRDSTQPNVKNLGKGDAVHFKGMIDTYNATPNLVITLENGKINEDEIPDQPKVAPKAKPKPKPRTPTRRTPHR